METCQTEASEAIEPRSEINSHFARYKVLLPGASCSSFLLSFARSFVRSFCCLIVFWFILLAGYYRSVEGANVSYLPSRVRCHSELPSVASVGDHRMGLRWTRTGRESGVVGCLSIKCHRCSIALVFPPATPRGSCPLSCTAFQLRCVCFLFAWLLVCFALPGDGLSLDQAPSPFLPSSCLPLCLSTPPAASSSCPCRCCARAVWRLAALFMYMSHCIAYLKGQPSDYALLKCDVTKKGCEQQEQAKLQQHQKNFADTVVY